jgi:hypothetical protein
VVYVGEELWKSAITIDHDGLKLRFAFIDVRKLDARPLVETGDLWDAVLAMLCAGGTDPDVIKAILKRIARAPEHQRADALAQLFALSKLRGIRPLIEQEYKAMPITVSVEDIPLLRAPIDRAYDKGRAEGKAEGQASGEAAGVAKSIETILRQRFPSQVPAGLANRLSHVAAEALDEILRKSLTAHSVADALGPDWAANGSYPKA